MPPRPNPPPAMPRNLDGLNPLAFASLPSRDVTIEQEARTIVNAARSRYCSPEDAVQAIIHLVGREVERVTDGLKGERSRPAPRHGFEEILTPREIADAYRQTVAE